MNKYSKLGKNVALITLGNFASKLLSYFMLPLYTAVLTTAEYGTADLMTTTINLLSPFFTLIISEAVMRFALDKGNDSRQVFSIGLLITVCGFVVMLVFSPCILLNTDLSPYYALFIMYYLVTTVHTLVSQFVKGIEKVTIYSLSGVIQTFAFVSLNILFLVVFKMGIKGYLLSLILASFTATLLLLGGTKACQYILPPQKIDRVLLKDMLYYSIPMIPNSLSWWVSNSSDKYMLSFFAGVGVTGIYSVSQRIPSLFAVISTIFIGAWQISAVEDFGSEESRKFYSDIYNKYSALNIIIVSALVFVSKYLGKLLFSNDFFEGWKYVPVLVFAFLFQAMANYLGTIYTSARQTKMLFISTLVAAFVNIGINALLIPQIGAQGAAIATLFSYLIVWGIRLYDTHKIIILTLNLKKDIISYLLIIGQIILILMDCLTGLVLAAGLFFIILFLNRNVIIVVLSMTRKILQSRKK